jgi:hypothetical protein
LLMAHAVIRLRHACHDHHLANVGYVSGARNFTL